MGVAPSRPGHAPAQCFPQTASEQDPGPAAIGGTARPQASERASRRHTHPVLLPMRQPAPRVDVNSAVRSVTRFASVPGRSTDLLRPVVAEITDSPPRFSTGCGPLWQSSVRHWGHAGLQATERDPGVQHNGGRAAVETADGAGIHLTFGITAEPRPSHAWTPPWPGPAGPP